MTIRADWCNELFPEAPDKHFFASHEMQKASVLVYSKDQLKPPQNNILNTIPANRFPLETFARNPKIQGFIQKLREKKPGHSTQDPEAQRHVKVGSGGKRKSIYGYKTQLNVDGDGFIKSTDYTAGNVHDSNCFTELLSSDETAVYADSAYRSQAHDRWLTERNIR